jgi:hypothetical protein
MIIAGRFAKVGYELGRWWPFWITALLASYAGFALSAWIVARVHRANPGPLLLLYITSAVLAMVTGAMIVELRAPSPTRVPHILFPLVSSIADVDCRGDRFKEISASQTFGIEMTARTPPKLATALLIRFVPGSDTLAGDLSEEFARRGSRTWYWRQVMIAVLYASYRDVRDHKMLTLRAIAVGWAFIFIAVRIHHFDRILFLTGIAPWFWHHGGPIPSRTYGGSFRRELGGRIRYGDGAGILIIQELCRLRQVHLILVVRQLAPDARRRLVGSPPWDTGSRQRKAHLRSPLPFTGAAITARPVDSPCDGI